MKKIVSVLLILIAGFILLVFQAPDMASKIEKVVGMDGLTSTITSFRGTVNDVSTNIPTKDDLVDTYNKLSSGAVDAAVDAKLKVDGVRETLSGAEETLDKTLKLVDDTQKAIEDGKEILKDIEEMSAKAQVKSTSSGSVK